MMGGRKREHATNADRQRAYRERKAARGPQPVERRQARLSLDSAAAVAKWAARRLKVPAGHPLAGNPLRLDRWQVAFLDDVLAESTREGLLCVARKNAKSATVAALLLAFLAPAGPLRRRGWRCGVLSVNRDKAGELLQQVEAIALASAVIGIEFKRTPAPGRIVSEFGAVDLESADRGAGHAAGYDLAIVDELGLLAEKHRHLVAGMRSSVSARDGRFMALTIHGDGPFVPEILKRRGEPGLVIHHYEARRGARLDDPRAWEAANPGLATGIKSRAYMEREARRVLATPADAPHFRAHDLNQPQSPTTEYIVDLADWLDCPDAGVAGGDRDGACVVGLDLGGSRSMTAAAVLWPATGRLEVYGAFPATPDLAERAARDRAGTVYQVAYEAGELWTYPGRVTPVPEFMRALLQELAGAPVAMLGCDRYRQAELLQALDGSEWETVPVHFRGTGAHKTADGSHDVRAFQNGVLKATLRPARGRGIMTWALQFTRIRRDGAGNPALLRENPTERIDPASASVIACGLGELMGSAPAGPPQVFTL